MTSILNPAFDSEMSKPDGGVPQTAVSDAPIDNQDNLPIAVAEAKADVVEPTDAEGSSDPDASGLDSIKPPQAPGDKARGATTNSTHGSRPNTSVKNPPKNG
ncbi:hypothetical protein MSAN_01309200 [Mycena sanguinolenta]|uniref:Uncharacterized protein n=1 Tax=Mycena sanguinolenta TaxID=230812 RepID=A0A8H7D300_9AGAR|nr:hypothetical protein MSAN_01309200 [Mycena sanguinolenta]